MLVSKGVLHSGRCWRSIRVTNAESYRTVWYIHFALLTEGWMTAYIRTTACRVCPPSEYIALLWLASFFSLHSHESFENLPSRSIYWKIMNVRDLCCCHSCREREREREWVLFFGLLLHNKYGFVLRVPPQEECKLEEVGFSSTFDNLEICNIFCSI